MDSHMLLNIDQYLIVRPYEFGETMSKIFDLCAHIDVSDPSVELISMKRLITVERNVLYPIVDIALIDGTCENRKHFDEINSLTTGVFRLVQGLDPRVANGLLKIDSRSMGYLFFIFKTMEDMASRAFLSQWKTWTGARLFRNALNPEIPMGRISFFRKASGALDFEFLLLVEMPTFKQHAAPILNALNLVRPRVNAFVGCYIDENFQVNASLGGRLFSRQLQELTSENEHIDDLIEATTLRIRFNNNSAKLEADGLVAGGECILKKIEANAEIVDENANFPPPEPAPALFLKRTGATQTDSEEDQQNRHISTQTEPLPPVEKPLKVDKDNSPMSGGDSRRHSLHSIPRTTAVHDFSTLFRDDSFLNVPKNIMGEKRRLSNNRFNSQTHVHFCDENENWQKLSDELDGHLRNMIRHSRRRSSSTIRKAGEDRDQFFKQLRERYFNSPDYHRDERMAEYRTVVIVNNT